MERRLIAIGGGEIRNKTTLEIDAYVAGLLKARAGTRRAVATFIGAASHDSMPYFNSFRKTYTSVFDIKAEVALTVYGEMNREKIAQKLAMADGIYIGGGDTKYLIEHLAATNLLDLVVDAYNNGTIIIGLSAGAIFWFKTLYSDYDIINGESGDYKILQGIGRFDGVICPHYNLRREEFDPLFLQNNYPSAYAIEDNAAIEFINEKPSKALSSGGNAYLLQNSQGSLIKKLLQ